MTWKDTKETRGRDGGFTLLEVLVAFVILAISMGVVLNIFSTGLDRGRKAEAQVMASLLAQSKLADLEAERPLASGESEGRFNDTYSWRAVITSYEEALDDEQEDLAAEIPASITAYRLTVTVSWRVANAVRSVTLATLRLAESN